MTTARADINSVLMQMRQLQVQAQGQVEKPELGQQGVNKADGPDFSEMMENAVGAVNEQQMQAKAVSTAYEQGDTSVDLTQVMISMQKASVSFEAMTQVRNRLIRAYEDIMKMPV